MRITDLATNAYALSLDEKRDLHALWITQSFKLGAIAGEAHIPSVQANNRLDLLIRQLEEEWEQPAEWVVDHSLDLRFSLSECWVLRAYEVVRAAVEQLGKKGEANERISALKYRLGLVRMPMAKAEIQQAKKATDPIVLVYADGTGAAEYVNDGTYTMPRQVCADSGSAMWCPVDIASGKSDQIRRIDLSDELLRLFD